MNIPTFDTNGRPFSVELSPWAIREFVEELKHVPEGYFALPGNAYIQRGDKYHVRLNRWTETSHHDGRPPQVSEREYVYVRAISSDPDLYAAMKEYADTGCVKKNVSLPETLPEINKAIEAAKQEIERLEKKVQELKDKEYGVEVTVDGKTYKAEYHDGYVQFGCAKIDMIVIHRASTLCVVGAGREGNRAVTAVQIGRGLFTPEQIEKMYEKMHKKMYHGNV